MSPATRDRTAARRWTLPTTVAILFVGGLLSTSLLTACLRRGPDDPPSAPGGGGSAPSSGALPPQLFHGWPTGKKPDVALILSGQQHSYLKFCGCSTPQLGGFERRYNFMKRLEAMGWPLVAADLGDVVQYKEGTPDQAFLKCDTAMKALEALGYSAITLGEDDHLLPLDQGVAQYYLQHKSADPLPRPLVVNLANKAQQFPHPIQPQQSWIGDWSAVGGKKGEPRVALIGLTGRTVINKINQRNPNIQFMPPAQTLQAMQGVVAQINAAKEPVDIKVLLFQGSTAEAQALCGPQLFPNAFDVILSQSDEDTPPAQPTMAGNTMIVRVGHKGKFIGVVGAYRSGNAAKPFDLFYQSVPMGPEYESDRGKEAGHPVLKLLDRYADEVKTQQFLKRTPQKPIPPNLGGGKSTYIGSQTCAACHPADFAKWKDSKHSHAIDALVKVADKPTQRQHDPECISCHVVGFGFKSGYDGTQTTKHLAYVGCESCHGPGSAHAQVPKDERFQLAMSPWKGGDRTALLPDPPTLQKGFAAMTPKEQQVYNRVNGDMCQKCHDPENDPHFKFEKNWITVIHGKNAAKAGNPPPGAAAQKKP